MTKEHVCIVGAGISGATLARRLAEMGIASEVIEARDHVAGNCHTEWDPKTECFKHVYGPHIFHTDRPRVIEWVNRFEELTAYKHAVKSSSGGKIFSLPINLHTINQFFDASLNPAEAAKFLKDVGDASVDPDESFETRALSMLGPQLYAAFFEGYTKKQWGVEPKEIPARILKRLPVRFNYDDNYFHHSFQALPKDGYTSMVEGMLAHPLISVTTNELANYAELKKDFGHVFWSGPLEEVFGADEGYLPYRTLDFDFQYVEGDFQGCPVMNYPELDIPYTRISQFNYFRPNSDVSEIKHSLIAKEYSRDWTPGDVHYYPVHLNGGGTPLESYRMRAAQEKSLHLFGRLGSFQYIDMDVAIDQALELADSTFSP